VARQEHGHRLVELDLGRLVRFVRIRRRQVHGVRTGTRAHAKINR
jgi:hypothetical protein